MYITSQLPDKTVSPSFTGSGLDLCGSGLIARYTVPPRLKERAWVTSWRGKKEKGEVHEFDRFLFKIGGCEMLHHCNIASAGASQPCVSKTPGWPDASCVDGGNYWMYLLNKHPALSTPLDFSPEQFMLTDDDLMHRTYAIQKTFAKVNSPRFGVAVQIAELGESLSYLKGIFSTIVRMFFKTKNSRHGLMDVFDRLKNPESTWLEWRYAILPMILTVQDLIKVLTEQVRPITEVREYFKSQDVSQRDHLFSYSYGKLCFTAKTTTVWKNGVGFDVKFQCDTAPWGTGAYDVILAAWEKTTLSFVLDWFFDVGQWLESFRDTALIADHRFATAVKSTELVVWLDESKSETGTIIVAPTTEDPFTVSAYHMNRIINDEVVPPTFPVFTPGKLSLLRQLDGISLLVGALKSLKR